MTSVLAGRRVVVTRSSELGQPLVQRLTELGAQVVHLPVVTFAAADFPELLDALSRSGEFDLMVCTSGNAIRFTCLAAEGGGLSKDRLPPVVAIGQATAAIARDHGLRVALVPDVADAEHVVTAMIEQFTARSVLVPQAHNARVTVADGLREAGWSVTAVTAYSSCDHRPDLPADIDGVDAITFASSATVDRFVAAVPERQWRAWCERRVPMVAIGARTAERLRADHAHVVVADEATDVGLVAALVQVFSG